MCGFAANTGYGDGSARQADGICRHSHKRQQYALRAVAPIPYHERNETQPQLAVACSRAITIAAATQAAAPLPDSFRSERPGVVACFLVCSKPCRPVRFAAPLKSAGRRRRSFTAVYRPPSLADKEAGRAKPVVISKVGSKCARWAVRQEACCDKLPVRTVSRISFHATHEYWLSQRKPQ